MNLIGGMGEGRGEERRIEWMVGTAVYQLQCSVVKSRQKVWAENLGGMTTDEPARSGARRPQTRPWTGTRGVSEVDEDFLELGLTVEERHDEESSIPRRELVRIANVAHRRHQVEMSKGNRCDTSVKR